MVELMLNPDQWVALDKALDEGMDSMTRSEAEKSFRKDISDRVKEELGVKPADYNQLLGERHNGKATDAITKLEEVLEVTEQIHTAMKNHAKKKSTD